MSQYLIKIFINYMNNLTNKSDRFNCFIDINYDFNLDKFFN